MSIGYEAQKKQDGSIVYFCSSCPHHTPTIDAARDHQAAHVAGPELLVELKKTKEWMELMAFTRLDTRPETYFKNYIPLCAAIAKAEPKG